MPYDSDARRAIDLATYADEAETIRRLKEDAGLSEEERQQICRRGTELVRDIRVALQADAAAHPPLADPGGGAPVPTVTLDRLEALLGASDYDAQTLFRSVAGGLRRSSPDQVDAMEAALARFDYDEVLALLRGLRSATPAGGG